MRGSLGVQATVELKAMTRPDDVLLVLTNLPDREAAQTLAHAVIEEKAAACVNILGACTSVYRWHGVVENAEEIPLLIKTTAARYAALETVIRRLHPYELPEIIAVSLTHGLPGYLQWVDNETRDTEKPDA
jgi:periplasmic divalent cation tolerance protein